MSVILTVPGTPKPKGSLRCIGRRGRIAHQLIEDYRPGQDEWRERVAYAAKIAEHPFTPGQPLVVDVEFRLERPANHHRSSRLDRPLRDNAPAYPVTRSSGDTDKLFRLIGDALVDGGLIPDDSQIIGLTTRKLYTDPASPPGARITVTALTR